MSLTILTGDALEQLRTLPDESVQCCVTSPPYWGLRDYGVEGQIGLEKTPEEFVAKMISVFAEVRRVLKSDGTCWVNLGDSYASGGRGGNPTEATSGLQGGQSSQRASMVKRGVAPPSGLKPKDLVGIPWMVAFALRSDGWYLRSDIIWAKPNPMPESVQGSHFSRHRVTVEEYENLSSMQYTGERAGDEWAGNMPSLSEIEVPMRKAPLSAKPKGNCGSSGKRRKSRGKGEASPLCGLAERQGERGEVSQHAEGEGGQPKAGSSVSGASGKSGGDSHGRGLDRDIGTAPAPMLLLQKDQGKDDAGSRNPVEQGRRELAGERGPSVQVVQLPETQQNVASLLVGCPGCPKCEKYHGYIFHLSAGRPTKSHEYLFLLTKSERYFYDAEAIREPVSGTANARGNGVNPKAKTCGVNSRIFQDRDPSHATARKIKQNESFSAAVNGLVDFRNKRSVWTVATYAYPDAHFATYPPDLIKPCILAGSRPGDTVLDPFGGSGTTGQVAIELGRKALLIELNPEYVKLIEQRCNVTPGLGL